MESQARKICFLKDVVRMRREGRVVWFSVYYVLKVIFSLNNPPSLQGEYNLPNLEKQYEAT